MGTRVTLGKSILNTFYNVQYVFFCFVFCLSFKIQTITISTYTISIKLSIFLYDPDFRSNEK